MARKAIDAKVRPLANNTGLEKASLHGAACVYVTKDSFLSLAPSLDCRPCLVGRILPPPPDHAAAPAPAAPTPTPPPTPPPPRQAMLCPHPQGMSANVVQMTRAFLDASGFKLGDQVRIVLTDAPTPPAARHVLVEDTTPPGDRLAAEATQWPGWFASWEFLLALSMRESACPSPAGAGVAPASTRRSVISAQRDASGAWMRRISVTR